MGEAYQLKELHDAYVWEVNAAIGEDRLDLVWQLADDYMDRALRLLTTGEPATCGTPGCAVCERSREPRQSRRHWFGRRHPRVR